MDLYQKCHDCGLTIPVDAKVCPYCARGFQGEQQKPISLKKKTRKQ